MRDHPAQLLALVWQPAKAKAQSPIIKIARFIVHPLTVLERLHRGPELFGLSLLVSPPFTGLVDAAKGQQSGKREPCLERDEGKKVHSAPAMFVCEMITGSSLATLTRPIAPISSS